MKFLTFMALSLYSFQALSQVCQVNLVDNYQRVIRVFTAQGDAETCIEGMKECRKTLRLEPHLGGVDCIKVAYVPQPQPIPGEVMRMSELEKAMSFVLEGCYVKPKVDGWANQLYINGKFSGNYQAGAQDLVLMRAIRDNQAQGVCLMKRPQELNLQFDPQLIDSAIDYTLSRNCFVKPNVDGWANQLYIDGTFNGNFDNRSNFEQMKLRATLASSLLSGRCMGRTPEELQLLRDPRLIPDFARMQYRGCYVKLNVDGWANQLYVRGVFKGNFHKFNEINKLQSTLVSLVLNGTCVYNPL